MPHLKAPYKRVTSLSDPNSFLHTESVSSDLGAYAVRGAVATITSQALRFLISISGTVVLARLLTPTDYGLIGMAAAITGIVAIFKDLGLDAVTIQREHITEAQLSTLFWINAATGMLLALITIGIAPAVAWFYGESSLTPIAAMSGLAFLLGGIVVQHEALLRRQMQFARLASVDVGAMLVGYATGIALAWSGAGYWALVFSQLAQGLMRTAALWLSVEWRPRFAAGFSGMRSMLTFGGHLTGFTLINYFARNLDNILIGRQWGAYQLGLYSRAYQLLTLPIDQIGNPITAVAVPALSRLANSLDRYRVAYLRILEKMAMLTMPLMALLIMTSDSIVNLLLGPQWSDVSTIFAFLGIAGIVQPVASTAGWLFITQGRADDMFRWGLIGGTLTITAILLGLPWGATGVAASYSVTTVVVVIPLLWWFVGRKGPVRTVDFYRTIGSPTAAVITIVLTLLIFRRFYPIQSDVLALLAAAGISTCLTFVVLSAFQSGRAALRDVGLTLTLLARWRSGRRILG